MCKPVVKTTMLEWKAEQKTINMRVRADRRGHFAERITCWWLRLAGYQIVAQRWCAVTG